jgi:hypothetical protein
MAPSSALGSPAGVGETGTGAAAAGGGSSGGVGPGADSDGGVGVAQAYHACHAKSRAIIAFIFFLSPLVFAVTRGGVI